MKELKLLMLFILLSLKIHSQKTSPIQIGETVEIESKYLKESRKLHIYLPLDFEKDSQESYSVFYLLDGGFDQDFLHISGNVQFLSFPWIGLLPPSILVAIENVDRTRDFTFPTEISVDKKDFPNSRGSANFINFLEHEVKPLIQKILQS